MQRSGATNSGVQGVSLYERTRWLARAFLLPTASLESRCRCTLTPLDPLSLPYRTVY